MSARTYRGGVPAPPKHISREMFEGGRTGDQARIDLAHAHYLEWLNDQGYPQILGRPTRADEAAR